MWQLPGQLPSGLKCCFARADLALDSKTGVRVIEALTQVNEHLGTTTLIVSHNAIIENIAHRVFSFSDAQFAQELRDIRGLWAQTVAIALVRRRRSGRTRGGCRHHSLAGGDSGCL